MAEWSLTELGWKHHFQQQVSLDEWQYAFPARVAAQHRSQFLVWSPDGEQAIPVSRCQSLERLTVGDWLLLEQDSNRPLRVLERLSLLQRLAPGSAVATQLIAANIDILLIVSSCNAEFNIARLERYLAVALEAGVVPLVVLTKADLCADPDEFRHQAEGLRAGLAVECVNALDSESTAGVAAWCSPGETLAMLGSSGVGKSTLANALGVSGQLTGAIREDDAKGRHTTTSRSLHRLPGGALLVDNPGLRELHLAACAEGVDATFGDVLEHANCRFSDCLHENEPGCGVLAAVADGRLDERRLRSYRKLQREQQRSNESLAEQRERFRRLGRYYRRVQSERRAQRDGD